MYYLRWILCLWCIGATDTTSAQSIRITAATISEGGYPAGAVDTNRGVCSADGGETTVEPFYDTTITLKIANPSETTLRLQSLRFKILGSGDNGGLMSRRISFYGLQEVGARSRDTTVQSLLLTARNGSKAIPGSMDSLQPVGFRNVRLIVRARTGSGRPRTLVARAALSLNNYNRC